MQRNLVGSEASSTDGGGKYVYQEDRAHQQRIWSPHTTGVQLHRRAWLCQCTLNHWLQHLLSMTSRRCFPFPSDMLTQQGLVRSLHSAMNQGNTLAERQHDAGRPRI